MTTLSQALHTCDMLLVDGLHAFEFTRRDDGLQVECMDGNKLKRWFFTAAQVNESRADGADWLINADQSEHRLVCMSAFSAPDEDDEETPADAPAND